MDIVYLENGDLAIFNGMKYRKDKRTGYYLNSHTRTRLHRAVWAFFNGEIPKGYHIHHIDEDKSNNDITNLELLYKSDHLSYHGTEHAKEHYDEMVENLINNAVPHAAAWHSSPEGRSWHSIHAKESIRNMKEKKYTCQHCGKVFYKKPLGEIKFCSNKCKSAYRRESGVDNEKRICVCCGKQFETNKYSKSQTCSRTCAVTLRWRKRNTPSRNSRCLQHGSRQAS